MTFLALTVAAGFLSSNFMSCLTRFLCGVTANETITGQVYIAISALILSKSVPCWTLFFVHVKSLVFSAYTTREPLIIGGRRWPRGARWKWALPTWLHDLNPRLTHDALSEGVRRFIQHLNRLSKNVYVAVYPTTRRLSGRRNSSRSCA